MWGNGHSYLISYHHCSPHLLLHRHTGLPGAAKYVPALGIFAVPSTWNASLPYICTAPSPIR